MISISKFDFLKFFWEKINGRLELEQIKKFEDEFDQKYPIKNYENEFDQFKSKFDENFAQ